MSTFALTAILVALVVAVAPSAWAQGSDHAAYPDPIRKVLANSRPLKYPLGKRLPLLLWPVHGGVVQDEKLQEQIISDLATRGIAMIASWSPGNREKALADSLRIARIQQKLGLKVCVNANACMYGFFNGD